MHQTQTWEGTAMRIDINNAGRLIPQLEIHGRLGHWIGGLRSIGADSLTYMSIVNALFVGQVFYRGSDLAMSIFPTVVHFYAAYLMFGVTVFLTHYAIIYPQTQRFNNTQSQSIQRSPTHRQTRVNEAVLRVLLEESDVNDPDAIIVRAREEYDIGGEN